MPTALQKARSDPDSMKARILDAARRLFGEYGYSGTTTRMIAREVGIDISTLYYHWGEKQDLYEAVVLDLNEAVGRKLAEIEGLVRGQALAARLKTSIDVMCDYLFDQPEVAKLILLRFFSKDREPIEGGVDFALPDHIENIAVAMGLALDKQHISVQARAKVMTVALSLLNFIAGEHFLRPMLGVEPERYLAVVKETLKFILVPAFTHEIN